MLTEGLHVDHLRLILGTSMGCMQAFVWGETYPTSWTPSPPSPASPSTLAGRNRMMRYMAIENIKNDPAWKNGEYTTEPVLGLRAANEMLLIMGSSPLQMQKNYPTRAQAAKTTSTTTLARTIAHTDANDIIYYVNASRNYNPEPKLSTITAPVLWINSADDFINPPETGTLNANLQTDPPQNAEDFILTSPSPTRPAATAPIPTPAIWKQYLIDFLAQTEKK